MHKNKYWKYAFLCIITFTLILGLRYMRGNDYLHYIAVYKYNLESSQILFTYFNNCLKYIGVGEHYIFIYYSLIYISCAMVLMKEFKDYAQWIFPFFLMSFTIFSEYMIRQAVGFSFLFLFIKYLLKPKMKLVRRAPYLVIFFLAAYSIHSANGLTAVLIIFIYLFLKKPIPPAISIPTFLVSSYLFRDFFDWAWLSPLLNSIDTGDSKIGMYVSQSDDWFSKYAENSAWERNPFIKPFQTWGECSLMFLGYIVINKYPQTHKFILLFNLYVIGCIFEQCFFTVEILKRMGQNWYWFWCFPLALVVSHYKCILHNKKHYKFFFIGLMFYSYEYLKYLFLRVNDMYLFIWDK